MTNKLIPAEPLADWQQAFYAFLAEKELRSGSLRTVESYSRRLQHFFGTLGKPPNQITSQEVFGYAHGIGLSGRKPAAVTVGARLACISSFYRFLIRMKILATSPFSWASRGRQKLLSNRKWERKATNSRCSSRRKPVRTLFTTRVRLS